MNKLQRFSVPGFRSGNPSHIIIAIAGYLMILYVSLTLRVENASSITVLWFERIICLIACLAVVFFTCNYKSIWKKLRIDRIQNIGFKTLAVIVADVVIAVLLVFLAALIESLL